MNKMSVKLKLNTFEDSFHSWSITTENSDINYYPNDASYTFEVKELNLTEIDKFNHMTGSFFEGQTIEPSADISKFVKIGGAMSPTSDATFKRFGSNDPITEFFLDIRESEDNGLCGIALSNNNRNILHFIVIVTKERFEEIISAIKLNGIKSIFITVSDVQGFYSPSTPCISDDVRLLTSTKKVKREKNCKITLPIIEQVGNLDFAVIYQNSLAEVKEQAQEVDDKKASLSQLEDILFQTNKTLKSTQEATHHNGEILKWILLTLMITITFTSLLSID